jgi:hypothetical protein
MDVLRGVACDGLRRGRHTFAKQQVPQPFHTEFGLLKGHHQPEIEPDHLDTELAVRPTRRIGQQACDEGLTVFSTQVQGVGTFHGTGDLDLFRWRLGCHVRRIKDIPQA